MRLSIRFLLFFSAFAAASLLSVAFIMQYGYHMPPCELCLLQRWPYAVIALLGLGGGLFIRNLRFRKLLLAVILLLFLADGGIAIYHAGVEAGIFKGPSACTAASPPGQTLEEMRRAIMEAELISCDQPMLHVLGLSIAGWNAVAALVSALVISVAWLRLGRKPEHA